ncbi:MAG: hypothetical protein IT373_18375 [Polyangiaceae bacterium]|nr:hypothetical protein [Polyangiaceae bacterium]
MARAPAWMVLVLLSACSTVSDTSEAPPEPPCQAPTPLGVGSGLVRCADGSVNRESAGSCTPGVVGPACQGTETVQNCTSDAECSAHAYGRCLSGMQGGGGQASSCDCSYSCATDADCDSGQACLCAGATADLAGARCAPASCFTNAACASGECSVSTYHDGCYARAYLACRSAADTCRVDAECTTPGETCDLVWTAGESAWACRSFDCLF